MQQAIAFMVSLRNPGDAGEFETAFRGQMQTALDSDTGKDWDFQLFRGEAPSAFMFVARFREEEFDRVSRANWPFVLLAIADLVTDGMKAFASDIRCLSAGVGDLHDLQEDWNQRFGRFSRLSFGTDAAAPAH